MSDQVWDLWFPGAGSTGLSFCRSRIAEDNSAVVLVHAAPPRLEVIVRDPDGGMLAHAPDLERTAAGPISRLQRTGSTITLQDGWPDDSDLGRIVLLPGGEAGVLTSWWHADDRSSWRWSVEFYNHR